MSFSFFASAHNTVLFTVSLAAYGVLQPYHTRHCVKHYEEAKKQAEHAHFLGSERYFWLRAIGLSIIALLQIIMWLVRRPANDREECKMVLTLVKGACFLAISSTVALSWWRLWRDLPTQLGPSPSQIERPPGRTPAT